MNITLKGNLKDYINKKVEEGLYEDAGDFVRDAIRKFYQFDPSIGDYRKKSDTGLPDLDWNILGNLNGGDIEAIAFLVLMQASKSAQEDLKAIMAQVKAINNAKAALRDLMQKIDSDIATNKRQKKKHPPLDFSNGMGNEAAYHHTLMPVADKDSKCDVEFIITDLFHGHLDDIVQLRAIQDDLKGKLDSMSEMGEMESLRLQMAMDRISKMMSTLSNILKKISDIAQAITQNLK
jgi:Arc/MetJ-type ribon-helix-helix transcriptional regulator